MWMGRKFLIGSSASYAEASYSLKHGMKVVAGERLSQWALLGTAAATPRAVFFAPNLPLPQIWLVCSSNAICGRDQ